MGGIHFPPVSLLVRSKTQTTWSHSELHCIRKKLPVAGSGGAGILSETTEKHIEKLHPVRIPVCFSVVSEILLRRKKGDYLCTRVFLWNWQAEP